MTIPEDCPKAPSHPISMSSRVTLATVIVALPLVVWAARIDTRVERLEQERVEMRAELRQISGKLDDIRERIPLMRSNP